MVGVAILFFVGSLAALDAPAEAPVENVAGVPFGVVDEPPPEMELGENATVTENEAPTEPPAPRVAPQAATPDVGANPTQAPAAPAEAVPEPMAASPAMPAAEVRPTEGTSGLADPIAAPGVDEGGVVIKTWGFLRDTTDALGSHTQDILRVQDDLKSMADDVETQRAAWHQAEIQMQNDNALIQKSIQHARLSLLSINYDTLLSQLQTELAAVQSEIHATQLNDTGVRATWVIKKQSYNHEMQQIAGQIEQVNAGMLVTQDEAQRATQLTQKQKLNLTAQVHNLEAHIGQIKHGGDLLDAEAAHNLTLVTDQSAHLADQKHAVETDLPQVENQAAKTPLLHQGIANQQAALAEVQVTLAETKGDCQRSKAELAQVLESEQKKLSARDAEVARCSSIEAQHQYVTESLRTYCPTI